MTKEEQRQLLLKDLCSRLPHRVKILYNGWDSDGGCEFSTIETLIGIDDRFIYTLWRNEKDKHSIKEPLSILDYKPYLRSMDSMTTEELTYYHDLCTWCDADLYEFGELGTEIQYYDTWESIEYLNSIHVDYRGLIPMKLAIEVTEENNPYKE